MKLICFVFAICYSVSPLYSQIVQIPDSAFKKLLLTKYYIDKNVDNQIQLSEAQSVKALYLDDQKIKDLTGLESFTSLTTLELHLVNPKMDLSKNVSLKELWIRNNSMKQLDVSKNVMLDLLYCDQNLLDSLDVTNNINLRHFWCWGNRLKKLDISKNSKLQSLKCGENLLSSLDLSNNTQLTYLSCNRNSLEALDLTHNPGLSFVECWTNYLIKTICVTERQLQTATANPTSWVKDKAAVWGVCGTTGLENDLTETSNNVKLVRMWNINGQEIPLHEAREGLFICLYSNGSIKKVIR